MPERWTWCRLGEISDLCLGKMLDKDKNKGTFHKYIGNINVRWGEFNLSDLKEMRFLPNEEDRFLINKDDVVICEGGEPGRTAIWKEDMPIRFQKALHRVRVNKAVLLSDYLYIVIRGDALAGGLNKHFTGVGIQHFTGKALEKYLVPLPPLAEQQRIVAKVQQLQQQLSQLEAQVQQSRQYAQQLLESVLKEAFEQKAKVYGMEEKKVGMEAEV